MKYELEVIALVCSFLITAALYRVGSALYTISRNLHFSVQDHVGKSSVRGKSVVVDQEIPKWASPDSSNITPTLPPRVDHNISADQSTSSMPEGADALRRHRRGEE